MITSGTDLRSALLRAARDELDAGGSAAVSLRAVARRAGVSHAAPGYAFGDRAGLLTAVAAAGFRELAAVMDAPAPGTPREALAALGRRYVDFARRRPALYDLMFRPGDLVAGDADLLAAQAASLRSLARLTGPAAPAGGAGGPAAPSELTLVAWAFVHGVASLAGQGALPVAELSGGGPTSPAVESLVERFAELARPDGG